MKRLFIIAATLMAALVLTVSCDPKKPLDDNGENNPEQPQKPEPEPDFPIYGRVFCGTEGIPGVVVTDGYEVTQTDQDGNYTMVSDKKNKMVWISIPSGYTTACLGVQALFYQTLTENAYTPERRDFELFEDGDQTNHTMLVFGDQHLAARTKDREQYKTFTADVMDYLASHKGTKTYAVTLGDMTWDQFWYTNNYGFQDYLADINEGIQGLTVFHTIGNHDHNMITEVSGGSSGWNAVDWDTAGAFREALGPNYFSFNIGQVHYVVVDNIYCKNTTGGTDSDRHYDKTVSNDCLAWLKKDLSYVDKSTPVVVTMHSAVWNSNGSANLGNVVTLSACFDGFGNVTFLTGHTHNNWNVNKGTIREYNSGAVCACWWWCGYYNKEVNIAGDGAPGGYRIMDWSGKEYTSLYKGTGKSTDFQFRSYDRNSIKVDTTGIKYAKAFATTLSQRGQYNVASTANEVILNVWDWDERWKVEVTENGTPLTVTKMSSYDPLFFLTYCSYRFKSTEKPSFNADLTGHLFKVKASSANSTLEIKVTDDEGRTYTESMQRPKPFNIETYK